MKKASIRQMYYYTMICNVFALICGIAGSIFILICSSEFIGALGTSLGLIFTIGVFVAFIFLTIFSLKTVIVLLKDYNALKRNEFISIIGKVKRFRRNREPESGVQINDTPVIMIIDNDEEIVLHINDRVVVGETYKFNYLRNCKIAEVSENVKRNP